MIYQFRYDSLLHKTLSINDLLNRLEQKSMYLPWWNLSDTTPSLIDICETMARLICHASRLKADDQKLKNLTPSYRMCSNCSMYVVEDLFHIIMQCTFNEGKMK